MEALAARLARAGCVAATEEATALAAAAQGDARRLESLVRRREAGEPLAWIVGGMDFGGTRVRVDPGVYVPRPHTIALAARATGHLPDGGVALDLCTGSGAVAVHLQRSRPRARVVAGDIDERAVACAAANGVEAWRSDVFAGLPSDLAGVVDVVTCVPPYVPGGALPFLPRDVLEWEPATALHGGVDGLDVVRRLIADAPRWLRPGGHLVVETGAGQVNTVAALGGEAGLSAGHVLRDVDGDERGVDLRLGRR